MAQNRRGRPARRPAPDHKHNTSKSTTNPAEAPPPQRRLDGFSPISRERMLQVATEIQGRHLALLCQAVAFAGIALGLVFQRTKTIPLPPRPSWVVIVGDDPVEGALGPDGFGDLKPLLRRATAVAVCSGAAMPVVYADAANAAARGGRVVIVETRVEHHAAWSALVRVAAPEAGYLDVSPIGGRA